jgi:hypothetical protein
VLRSCGRGRIESLFDTDSVAVIRTNLNNVGFAMGQTIIVWDIETVPDLRGFAAARGLIGKSDDEVPSRARR